ncbi:unnamed protein product [Dicrocoelium dendriticum]|nr:unnamed protein product [Dicrocoelium dendriticum]
MESIMAANEMSSPAWPPFNHRHVHPWEVIAQLWRCVFPTSRQLYSDTRTQDYSMQSQINLDSDSWSFGSTTEAQQDAPLNLCLRDHTENVHFPKVHLQMRAVDFATCSAERGINAKNTEAQSQFQLTTTATHVLWPYTNGGIAAYPTMLSAGPTKLEHTSPSMLGSTDSLSPGSNGMNSNALDREHPFTSTPLHEQRVQRRQRPRPVSLTPTYGEVSETHNRSSPTRMRSQQGRVRRRRVGWRGVAMCGACNLVCSSMDQLNLHYQMAHSELLLTEWQIAQSTGTNASKMLFQAQLEQLRSQTAAEMSSGEAHHTPTGSALNTDNQRDVTKREKDEEVTDQRSPDREAGPSFYNSPLLALSNPDNRDDAITTYVSSSTSSVHIHELHTHSPLIRPEHAPNSEGEIRALKEYPCPRCSYTAKWPTELQKHVMVHSIHRPFVCSVCSTSYKWSWDLGRHFANAHPGLLNPYKKQRFHRHPTISKKSDENATTPSV